jgi:hypothetical protein
MFGMHQADTVAAIGTVAAGAHPGRIAFALDRRDEDHWVQLASFTSRKNAEAAKKRAVRKGAEESSLRIRKYRVPSRSGR